MQLQLEKKDADKGAAAGAAPPAESSDEAAEENKPAESSDEAVAA